MKLPRVRLPRMTVSIVLSLVLAYLVAQVAPHQQSLALFKFWLVAGAGVAGYYLDREMFPYARPDCFLVGGRDVVFAAAMLRRAMIVIGYMLAAGLGA